jgi:predicted nuclease of predicted toxin-antitoxin system
MRLKLDENLGRAAAGVLQSAGYDVQTVPQQGLSQASDREVIAACRAEQRCLVTLDLDFGNPLVFDPAAYAGIAVLRLPGRPSHQDIVDACRTLVAGLRREDIEGKLWIVQRSRIREYQGEDRS